MSNDYTVEFNADALLRKLARLEQTAIDQAIDRAGNKAALYLEGEIKNEITPFTKTGRLRSSIRWARKGRFRWAIGTDVEYARPLEEGSGLYGPRRAKYRIEPKKKKALAWPAAGATIAGLGHGPGGSAKGANSSMIVRRSVMHPGVRPKRYMRSAIQRSRAAVERIFQAEIAAAINQT